MNELLLGCGSYKEKRLWLNDDKEWKGLITLDNNPDHDPDILWDMDQCDWDWTRLPFGNNKFNEIHAYDSLEHWGKQGHYKWFFNEWSNYWDILKPEGLFFGTVPLHNSIWAFGDPSHKRVITKGVFTFLDITMYKDVGITNMSDFRHVYDKDFEVIHIKEEGETLQFILKAHKPPRIKWTKTNGKWIELLSYNN